MSRHNRARTCTRSTSTRYIGPTTSFHTSITTQSKAAPVVLPAPGSSAFVFRGVLYRIVWRFLCDRDVVRVTFRHARGADPAETGVFAKLLDRFRPAITHS